MGGDGGTKAVNRTYLRGAGAATTSGDIARQHRALDPAVAAQEALRRLTHCALTDQPLFAAHHRNKNAAAAAAAGDDAANDNNSNSNIVACPHGRLYHREAVVEALIRRKQQKESSSAANDNVHRAEDDSFLIIRHIRGLKDLHAVQFQLNDARMPICPVTSRELTGKGCAAYALLRGDGDGDNKNDPAPAAAAPVVSGYALQQVGEAALLQEYGAATKLRLAPPADALPQIRQQWEERCAAEKAARKSQKKKKNKRKHNHNGENRDGTGAKKTRNEIADA